MEDRRKFRRRNAPRVDSSGKSPLGGLFASVEPLRIANAIISETIAVRRAQRSIVQKRAELRKLELKLSKRERILKSSEKDIATGKVHLERMQKATKQTTVQPQADQTLFSTPSQMVENGEVQLKSTQLNEARQNKSDLLREAKDGQLRLLKPVRGENIEPKVDIVKNLRKIEAFLSSKSVLRGPGFDRVEDAVVASPCAAAGPNNVSRLTGAWKKLRAYHFNHDHLIRHQVVTASDDISDASEQFDILRTRLMSAMSDFGWSRIAITSPTHRCGKTFTAAKLAIALSRFESCRTLLLDLDLRNPSLHRVMGMDAPGAMEPLLLGQTSPEDHLVRIGPKTEAREDGPWGNQAGDLAIGLNSQAAKSDDPLSQNPNLEDVLETIDAKYAPDLMLFDLPPVLGSSDVLALRPLFDAVLLVVGSGVTSDHEIKNVKQLLSVDTPLMGLVLNKANEQGNFAKFG